MPQARTRYFSWRIRLFRAAEGLVVAGAYWWGVIHASSVSLSEWVIGVPLSVTVLPLYLYRSLRLSVDLLGDRVVVRNLFRTWRIEGRRIRSADRGGEAIVVMGPNNHGWTISCLELNLVSGGWVDLTATCFMPSDLQGEVLTRLQSMGERGRRAARGLPD